VTEPKSDPVRSSWPDPIDELVAGYLESARARTDSAPLLERIEADRRLNVSVVTNSAVASERRIGLAASWSLIAVALAVAFLVGRSFDGRSAQAATLLRNVQTVHKQSIDRCYRVQHAQEGTSDSQSSAASESILWTRGDRAWTDTVIGPNPIKIGRDETGTIWFAPSPKKGLRFSPKTSEFPKEVEALSQISWLTVPVLVDEVLADFDVKKEGPVAHADGRRSVIWAHLKEGRSHAFLSAAMLEVDVERNLLVRLVLWLHKADGPNGTVTYTLIDRPSPGEASYRLESHLDADAVIEDKVFEPAK
jgi:hypothetical protein